MPSALANLVALVMTMAPDSTAPLSHEALIHLMTATSGKVPDHDLLQWSWLGALSLILFCC